MIEPTNIVDYSLVAIGVSSHKIISRNIIIIINNYHINNFQVTIIIKTKHLLEKLQNDWGKPKDKGVACKIPKTSVKCKSPSNKDSTAENSHFSK